MGATLHRIHPLDGAEDFQVNGWTPLRGTDSNVLLEQAHSMVTLIVSAVRDTGDSGAFSNQILSSAIEGIETMISLALVASKNEDKQRGQARAA